MGFIISMHTPIVKIRKGKKDVATFFTLQAYHAWKERNPWVTEKNVKYYKGLATSTRPEAVSYFRDLSTYEYVPSDYSREKVDMAFNKKRADNRKDWLRNYVEHNILDVEAKEIAIDDFIDKDLIHFSNYDNHRSIPSMCDGLKPSQRKALYGMYKMNVRTERKVADIQGPIMSISRYHHGDASMTGTITGMADNYVGSNNINLLYPGGMFGTRLQGGKDCGSARYVFSCLERIADVVFRQADHPLLEFLDDDGTLIEPRWYLPIIPMVLVNGSHGIGTGFSTHIPCFNPQDLIARMRLMIDGKKAPRLKPWFRGFKGKVVSKANKWFTEGKFEFKGTTSVLITELPIGIWTDDYHIHLEKLLDDSKESDKKKKAAQCLVSYKKEKGHDDVGIKLTLTFRRVDLDKFKKDEKGLKKFKKTFKLEESKSCSVSNLHMFDPTGSMVKFKTVDGILRSFFRIRLPFYVKRREYVIKALERDLKYLDEKVRFIEGMVAEIIHITRKQDPAVLIELRDTHGFQPDPSKIPIVVRPVPNSLYKKALEGEIFEHGEDTDISSAPSDADTDDSDSDSSDSDSSDSDSSDSESEEETDSDDEPIVEETKDERDPRKILNEDYGYLVSMQIRTLTQEKADALKAERAKKAAELERMKVITPRQLWKNELDELEEALAQQGY
jgi:DNA topoisomerase-2